MAIEIDITVDERAAAHPALDGRELSGLLRRAVRAVLDAHDIAACHVSVTLLDDTQIEEMNRAYLDHEGPTDVISFELGMSGEARVGDVYIGWEQALRQAAEFGVSPREELARLAVHGTLHVLGYDHPTGEGREQSEMWQRQEEIVREVVAS